MSQQTNTTSPLQQLQYETDLQLMDRLEREAVFWQKKGAF